MSNLPYQSDYKHLLRQRKPRGRIQDWDHAAQVALMLVSRGMSIIRASRVLQVPQAELSRLLNSERYALEYARAERERAAFLAEEALTIADDRVNDPDPNSRRLRVDTRKWFAARMDPKRWGDRIPLPDAESEQARALAAMSKDAAHLALAGIVGALGLTLQSAPVADSRVIEGQSKDVTKP